MHESFPIRQPDFDELRFLLIRMRKVRNWTLDELAERSGVGRRTLVQLESGKSHGSLETWFYLAEAFELEIGEVLASLYGSSRSRK